MELQNAKLSSEAELKDILTKLSDATDLIKGEKGTNVFLTVKRVDGGIEQVEITRDVVELEETYAKSSIIKDDSNVYGLINLPRFYVDFADYGERNAASDIKKEILGLKSKGINGLILDLRNNGGGFYNHNLFWNIMAQNAGGKPTGELAAAIDAAYGSFDAFKAELKSSVQSPKVRFSNSKMVKEIETYKDKYDTMRLRNST